KNCTAVGNCADTVTCTKDNNSQCGECKTGYYLENGNKDTCTPCTNLQHYAHCLEIEKCDEPRSLGINLCTKCEPGTYLQTQRTVPAPAGTCQNCRSVSGCVGNVTCTNGFDSRCSKCSSRRYMVE